MNNKNKNILDHKKNNINDIITYQNKKIEDLKSQLLNNKKKINDITLRTLAKIENIKKTRKENIKNIKKIELEKFLKTIIPIIDSLKHVAMLSSTLEEQDKPVVEGITLTLQSLLNIMYKLGVKIEGKKDEIFNPKLHTAILIEPYSKISNNHIISVEKCGFTLNNVLLRKALVTISKK